jgi:hypothetical protein
MSCAVENTDSGDDMDQVEMEDVDRVDSVYFVGEADCIHEIVDSAFDDGVQEI